MKGERSHSSRPTPSASERAVSEFLDQLRSGDARPGKSPTALPEHLEPVVRQVHAEDQLVRRFESAATKAGMTADVVSTDALAQRLAAILAEHSIGRLLRQALPDSTRAPGIDDALEVGLRAAACETTTETSDEALFSVDAALTGVDFAIAETGSLVCLSGPGAARGTTLIPPFHIAIVRTDQIVPDVYDVLPRLPSEAPLPANVNIITGPSKTADIEGILITGVHGPGVVRVIVVNP